MQCPACRVVYSNGLGLCPRCSTPAKLSIESTTLVEELAVTSPSVTDEASSDEALVEMASVETRPSSSILLEFPSHGRGSRPAWRKELGERVREIQERRAREAALEAAEVQMRLEAHPDEVETTLPLGLVPQPDQPALNPIVIAALKRIERAQKPAIATRPTSRRGASVAVARVAEEQYVVERRVVPQPTLAAPPELIPEARTSASPIETPRPRSLTVVQPKVIVNEAVTVDESVLKLTTKPTTVQAQVNSFSDIGEDFIPDEFYDDYAPLTSRFIAGVVDLGVIIFASSPFAAIIELTNGDWTDERVLASMAGIFGIVMFLYLTSSTVLSGRTWGMSLLSLRPVDVDSGLPPTTRQAVTRAIAYMLSLATFGLGLLYAAVDAEGRGLHDHVSGTTVVRE